MMSLSTKIDEMAAKIACETGFETSNLNFLCGICKNSVKHNQKLIFCDQYNNRIHIECNDISISEYKQLQNESDNIHWVCLYCTVLNNSAIFPFTLVPDSVFQETNDFEISSNDHLACSSFEITSRLTNLPNLSDYDIDENIKINLSSQYYSLQEMAALEVSNKDYAVLHMNIRSLSFHYEEFHAFLFSLKIDFQVIGLSKIRASMNAAIKSNIQLPGYKFYHTLSHSAAGGVGIYVKENLTTRKRQDLSIGNVEFQTL